MRFHLTILLLAGCGASFAQSARPEQAAPARVELVDRIVAVVNKEVITQYELAERMNRVREELRNEILMNRLRDREVTGKITVSEGEIENLLLEQGERKDIATEYNIAHILVRVPEQATPEQLETRRARAEEVVKRLRDGTEFAQLAATYSDAPDALQGGVMGWRSQQRLPELYVEALAGLKPGGISSVFRSPAGFHVLKLLELRGAGAPLLVEQAHVRHILARTNDLVSEDEAKRKLLSLRERIVNGVNFAELARLNSDDGSASRGGDLGWIYR